jgi:type I restriction enzyme R subunit
MTPEQEAREEIDDQLHQTGWAVQSADEMDITAARGVAVSEFPLETGFADYLLYGDAKALGTIEAKPKGHTLKRCVVMMQRLLPALLGVWIERGADKDWGPMCYPPMGTLPGSVGDGNGRPGGPR